MHFFSKKFAHIKKKLYLCTVIQKGITKTQYKPSRNNSQMYI